MKMHLLLGEMDGEPHIFMRRQMTIWEVREANRLYEKFTWTERWVPETRKLLKQYRAQS